MGAATRMIGQVAFERLGDRFRGQGAADYGISPWALAVVAAVAIGLAFYLARRFRASRKEESRFKPKQLFSELCGAHELNRKQRRILKKLAGRLHLRHPAALFLDATAIEQALRMPQFLDQHEELEAIEERLFPAERPDSDAA